MKVEEIDEFRAYVIQAMIADAYKLDDALDFLAALPREAMRYLPPAPDGYHRRLLTNEVVR